MNLKIFTSKFLDNTRILSLLKNSKTSKLTVLMYHHTNKKNFEEQIIYLKKNYNMISEKEFLEHLYNNKKIKSRSILITFDDGYKDTFTQAYPVLKKHGIPAIVFLPTKFIEEQTMAWYDLLEYHIKDKNEFEKEIFKVIEMKDSQRVSYMKKYRTPKRIPSKYQFANWNEIKKASDIFSYGSHTHSHPISIQSESFEKELDKSNKLIKKNIGKTPKLFAYPVGIYNNEIIDKVSKVYDAAFTVTFGSLKKQVNKFEIPRIGIPEEENISVFKVKLSCLESIFKLLKPKRFSKI